MESPKRSPEELQMIIDTLSREMASRMKTMFDNLASKLILTISPVEEPKQINMNNTSSNLGSNPILNPSESLTVGSKPIFVSEEEEDNAGEDLKNQLIKSQPLLDVTARHLHAQKGRSNENVCAEMCQTIKIQGRPKNPVGMGPGERCAVLDSEADRNILSELTWEKDKQNVEFQLYSGPEISLANRDHSHHMEGIGKAVIEDLKVKNSIEFVEEPLNSKICYFDANARNFNIIDTGQGIAAAHPDGIWDDTIPMPAPKGKPPEC